VDTEPKDTRDGLHPKIPKTNFFSSGYLLLSSCTLPKVVAFVQVQGIQERHRKMRRKTGTGHPHAAAKRFH